MPVKYRKAQDKQTEAGDLADQSEFKLAHHPRERNESQAEDHESDNVFNV